MQVIQDALAAETVLAEETVGVFEGLTTDGAVQVAEFLLAYVGLAFLMQPRDSCLDTHCTAF